MQCLALAGFEPRYTVPRFGQPTCTSQYTSKKEVYHISNPDRASCSFMLSGFVCIVTSCSKFAYDTSFLRALLWRFAQIARS